MTLASGTRLGPYEVVELLGAGGMGEVYRARDSRLGRAVAVKVLSADIAQDPDRLRRFEQEAQAVAALNDPHILTVHDVGTDEGTPYVVSELLEGETLREVLSRRTPTPRQVLGWALQIAQGLAAAHRKGIVHRDVKPENLFLTVDGRVKILDFGLAKVSRAVSIDSQEETGSSPSRPGLLLGTVPYMSPEQVRAVGVDARSDIFSFGVVLYELLTGRHPFRRATVGATLSAILNDEPPALTSVDRTLPPAVDGIVRRCLAKDREDRFQGAHDLAFALEAVLQAPTGSASLQEVEERSPYPGLSSFTEKDAAVFFGREAEVKALWEKIRSRRLSGVVGPSGAGKTSFVRAGVVASRPEGWGALVCTPGAAPFRGLGHALLPALAGDIEALRGILSVDDPAVAFDLVSRWRRGQGEGLLVVDQFEELFTLNAKEAQGRFADLLGRLAREGEVRVLLSLRDDFLMKCADHEAITDVFESLSPLPALSVDSLRRALEEPARRRGYRFEDESLVGEMVEAVEGARAALPLLAFAVSRLWEKRDREKKVLTRAAYEEVGGVAGALAQHAEVTMDRIGHERQNLVREIFRNLVTAHGTRAVVDREELLSAFPERTVAESVLRELIDARLLTSYEVAGTGPAEGAESAEARPSHHRIEIVHESLLTAWPRLVRWQAQDEEGALLRDQLKQAAHLWEEKGRTTDLLWTGMAYREYELWRERYPGTLTAVEEGFANAMVDKARRRKRLVRLAVATAFVALSAVAVAIGISRQQATSARDYAKAEALRAEASKVLTLGQLRLKEDPTEALAFATASLVLSDTNEARQFAVRALAEAPPAWEVLANIPMARSPRFSPDGHWLSVAGHSTEVGVWRQDGGPPLRLPDHETSPRGSNVAHWVSEAILVTGLGTASRAFVWSLPEGRRLRTIEFGAASYWQAGPGRLFAETPEGTPTELFDGGGLLRTWRLPEGEPEILGRIDGRKLGITSSFFEPYGRGWFYTKGDSTRLVPLPLGREMDRPFSRHAARVLWSISPGPVLLALHDDAGENRLLRFRESGSPVTTILPKPGSAPVDVLPTSSSRWVRGNPSQDVKLRLWDTAALPNARPLELCREGAWYAAGCFVHPSDALVVATTHNLTRLTFWPLPVRWPSVVDGYKQLARPLAFSPDGRWLATAWDDGRIRLWRLPGSGGSEVKLLNNSPRIGLWESIAFDPGGRYLFAVGLSDNAWIIPLDGARARKLHAFSTDTLLEGDVAAVSPTGRHVATAFSFGKGWKTLRVWDVETGAIRLFDLPDPGQPPGGTARAPTGAEAGVLSVVFVDEATLYTAGHGGVRRWNLETGSHELVLSVGPSGLAALWMAGDRHALVRRSRLGSLSCPAVLELLDLATGAVRTLEEHGDCLFSAASGPSELVVSGSPDGIIRVARHAGDEPHILAGHIGRVDRLAISPDGRWIASTGEDNTLRLWPMPDLDKPPLHTLPREELLAKLQSLTNLRAVRDSAAPSGWKVELGPFPGWKNLPKW